MLGIIPKTIAPGANGEALAKEPMKKPYDELTESQQTHLHELWRAMCNWYGGVNCERCPFRDEEGMCYDSAGEIDENKFLDYVMKLKDGREPKKTAIRAHVDEDGNLRFKAV